MTQSEEATVSLRWALPFLRVTGSAPCDLAFLASEGIGQTDFASAETRMPHRVLMDFLSRAVSRLEDPLLGLRASECLEAGDFELLEYAYRSCKNLREATVSANRYMHLMHGAQEGHLVEQGDLAMWQVRVTDQVPQLPQANDFSLASACWIARRYTGRRSTLREVHFQHDTATSVNKYGEIFDGARIRLGMPHNALLFDRALLDAPMSLAHEGVHAAFVLHAEALLTRLKHSRSVTNRVRRLLLEHLAAGDMDMQLVARRVAMSVPTLRRRLLDEGTSHSQILDDIRRELSQRYLSERKLAIAEVSYLLGFANSSTFHRAFARWFGGQTPAKFRAYATGLDTHTHPR